MPKVDLFLGGTSGQWVLEWIINHCATTKAEWPIRYIITMPDDDSVGGWGLPGSLEGDANEFDYEPAKVGLSVHYPRLLSDELLAKYDRVYNIHPGYLPYGRGYYPVFWALWEDTPAGATLHQIDGGISTGPIVAQQSVPIRPNDTGGSLHKRIVAAERTLFLEWWPRIVKGEELSTMSQQGSGTYHDKVEFFRLKRQDCRAVGWCWPAAEVLHLARCFTFPGYTGLEVELGGQWFHLRLKEMANV